MNAPDIDHLRTWIGRTQSATDTLTAGLVERFSATIGNHAAQVAGSAPLAIHWCLAPPAVRGDDTGEDGHPKRGGFLPPVPLARRMWAGGSLEFVAPLQTGDEVTRRSIVTDVAAKTGRSGELVFVTVSHEISTPAGIALRERQDLVYRDGSSARPREVSPPSDATGADMDATWVERSVSDSLLLFRYSALTFNGHRIHYDPDYAKNVEGYEGLVVHGPLQATLLLHLAARCKADTAPQRFDYRGVSPLICNRPFTLCASPENDGVGLRVATGDGRTTMQASARW